MSTLILVPGFWLDASSWDRVVPTLEAAGHDARALTLPGLESRETNRSGIGLAEHVAAVVAVVDEVAGPVVLVGSSGGGTVIHAVVDQRPERVRRAVYVDAVPVPDGVPTNAEVPAEGDDIPLPPWEAFTEDGARDLDDLTPQQLDAFRAVAVPHPRAAAQDPQVLHDERRWAVPATIILTTFTRAEIDQFVADGEAEAAELPRLTDVTYVELPTSHWPQLTRPDDLAAVIVDAVS